MDEETSAAGEPRIAHATFPRRMRRGQASVQKTYSELATSSRLIRHFETVYVPGPLQIPDYARRVLTEMITLHDLERIRLGIVPMGVELATTPQNTVEIYVGDETVAVAETYIGATRRRPTCGRSIGSGKTRLRATTRGG